jgi:hypothetical protein
MKHVPARVVVNALSLGLIFGLADRAASLPTHSADGPVIQIEDVAAFYKLYDATNGHPTADQLPDLVNRLVLKFGPDLIQRVRKPPIRQ